MSNEKFACAYKVNLSVCPKLIRMSNSKIRLKFKESCLKQEDKAISKQEDKADSIPK